jgi:hypothetical protein
MADIRRGWSEKRVRDNAFHLGSRKEAQRTQKDRSGRFLFLHPLRLFVAIPGSSSDSIFLRASAPR